MTQTPWWQSAVIYQIYPKSFQDSAARGTGDLKGIMARLDYLKTLGVDALWLTPVYVSPQVDNGYDIADYLAIDPAYGTMSDFEALLAASMPDVQVVLDTSGAALVQAVEQRIPGLAVLRMDGEEAEGLAGRRLASRAVVADRITPSLMP